MTQPIGSAFCNPPSSHPFYDDPIGTVAKNLLSQRADCDRRLLGCDETTVVSNACRSPNAVDAFVCDDKKMAELQHGLWETIKDTVRAITGVLIGRML